MSDIVYAAVREARGVVVAGTLAWPWARRGDFQRLWRAVAPARVGWKRIRRDSLAEHSALIDALLSRAWLRLEATVARGVAPDVLLRTLLHRVPVGARLRLRERDLGCAPAGAALSAVTPGAASGLRLVRLLVRALAATYGDGSPTRAKQSFVEQLAEALSAAPGRLQVRISGETSRLHAVE